MQSLTSQFALRRKVATFFGMCVTIEMTMMKHVNSFGPFTLGDRECESDMTEKVVNKIGIVHTKGISHLNKKSSPSISLGVNNLSWLVYTNCYCYKATIEDFTFSKFTQNSGKLQITFAIALAQCNLALQG